MPCSRAFLFHALLLITCLFSTMAWGAPDWAQRLDELERGSGAKLHYSRHARTGAVRSLRTDPGQAIPLRVYSAGTSAGEAAAMMPETAATHFLERYGTLFGIKDPARELAVKHTKTADRERSFVRFQQLHKGVPVIGGELVVQLDAGNGIMSAHGRTSPDAVLDTAPGVSAAEAKETALKAVAERTGADSALLSAAEPELSVYDPGLLDHREGFSRVLVWRLEVKAADLLPINDFVLIDAKTGRPVLQFSQIDYVKSRTIYDSNNVKTVALPGTAPVRTEGGGPSGITDADLAYDYLGDTYDFYYSNFGRDSVNGSGLGLIGTVRYCPNDATPCPYQNAFWSGTQMVFGQGYAAADDVVAHELTHAVTQYTSGLFYYMQSGAINESLSDIFGEFVDLTNGRGTDSAAVLWKMGEDLAGGAIRDMKDPPSMSTSFRPYPDRMTSGNYFCGNSDNGGVHFNSSVSNKAAYLMTDGGTFNGRNVTGLGITKAAKIFYEAQVHLLTSASDFADLYDDLILACNNLTGTAGITAADCQQVQNALDAVEMSQQPTFCAASEAPLCPAGTTPVDVFFDNFEAGAGNWTSMATVGINAWATPIESDYATSGTNALYGKDLDTTSDSYIRTSNLAIPANAYLHFRHFYEFEYGMISPTSPAYYDGGVLEYSTNAGSTWQDAGPLFINNGYTQTISTIDTNPLLSRSAFAGVSNGFISSRLNLGSLGGQNARFRFRIGTDSSGGARGWAIDDFRVYTCSDTFPPSATATTPADGAAGIPVNSKMTATFSEAMTAGTITGTTFTLVNRNSGGAVAGTVGYNASTLTATFTPSANLSPDTPYLATISTGATDATGHVLAAAKTWRFRTSSGTDAAAPAITARSPALSATGVPLAAPVIACFSEPMDAATLTSVTFSLNNGVTGSVGYTAATNCAVFTPSANLAPSTTYTATITGGVKDAAGNALAGTSWSFTTTAIGAATEIIINGGFENTGGWYGYSSAGAALLASGTGHNNSASIFGYLGKTDNTYEYIYQPITIPANATAAYAQFWYRIFTTESPNTTPYDYLYAVVTDGDGLVLETLATKSNVNASSTWLQSAQYDLKKYKGRRVYLWFSAVNDESAPSTFLIDDVSVMVTTPPADTAAPAVVATGPAAAAAGAPINGIVGATFSEAMDAATITNGTFTLNNGVTGAIGYDKATCTATLAPSAQLAPNTTYTATISTGAKDLAGNALSLKTWSFTTGALTQTLSVTIAGTGAGTVNSSPGGIACGSGTCSAPFYFDLPVTLVASPAAGSIFAGWTGACTGSGDCRPTIDFNKSTTGTFDYYPAHIFGAIPGNYPSLQAAYDAAAGSDLIQVQAAVLAESPLFSRPVAITLKGGYDNNFAAVTGSTLVQGTLTIQAGTVTIDNVTVR